LLEAAWRTIPAIEELPIAEMWVGHRPGSRDDAPILGPGPIDGLIYATGHHRNGILLVPATADAVSRIVLDGVVDPVIAPFRAGGFARARAGEAAECPISRPHPSSPVSTARTSRYVLAASRRCLRRRRFLPTCAASPSPSTAG